MYKGRIVSRSEGKVLLSLLLMLVMVLSSALPGMAVVAAAADDGTTSLITYCQDAEGKNYKVTASYTEETGIPADAALSVKSVTSASEGYDSYVSQAEQQLSCSIDRETGIQLFDISLVGGSNASVEYQPAEGTSVNMTVRLTAAPEAEMGVIHFGDETERIDSEVTGRNVSFEATGFSVYAFVSIESKDNIVHDISGFGETPVYISTASKNGNVYYMKDTIISSPQGTVIARTAANSTAGAAAYGFEKIAGTDNRFYMFLPQENGARKYVKLTTNTATEWVSSAADATALTILSGADRYANTFLLSFVQNGKTWYLNLRKDDAGKGFNGSDYGPPPLDSVSSYLTAYYFLSDDDDVLEMDGKTYGIVGAPVKNEVVALTAEARSDTTLAGESLPVRANPLDNSQDVSIKVGGDLAMYTFYSHDDNDYYITTQVGGATRYLKIKSGAVTLVDTPDEYSVFRLTLGAGETAGRIKITGVASGQSLSNTGGTAANGFAGRNSNTTNEYFYFAEKVDLGDDDFVPYTAIKVSVSDKAKVHNGSKVIVYTRIWNETNKRYEFYAIDHDGSLKRVYDEGDTIRWAGAQINTLLWEFTEYYYWPYFLRIPNYYYELQNAYSGKYLAPQVHTNQILSDRTIGINLNGRRYEDYYTTILAWDDYRYDYAGLKSADDNSAIVSVPMSKAQDFYFAIMDDPVPDEFSTVETVNNSAYGISMRMINYQGEKSGGRDKTQTDVMGSDTIEFTGASKPMLDLVTTDLKDNGYPVATHTNKSLEELFGNAEPVNHLFLKSTYEESGYFEYDCTQTFASLRSDGDFRVYNQIGTVETSTNSQGHGFFMPFNDIDPNLISAYTNVTNVVNEPLSTNDPRLGERLYSIPKDDAQYHFGMEMEASFIQSKDGLDAWGHDIIFDFAGDDDMWLYVDGELVLDLGGVHSAVVGKINFRTGEVSVPDAAGTQYTTTLRQIFENNFRERNPGCTEEDVAEFLELHFRDDTSIFKDYSSHTMKMFYMERGSGASNLHMRFNLTTATDGQLLLSKKVSGTDKQDYTSARFAYQIYYYDLDYADWRTVQRTEFQSEGKTYYEYSGISYINYQGTKMPVEYVEEYEGFADVFFLKPGEVAEIQFPDDTTKYRIRECHVNTEIYDHVYANDVELAPNGPNDFAWYQTEEEVIGQRKVVNFDNHVSPNALRTLTITKALYDEKGNKLTFNADDPDNDDTGFRFRVYIGPGTDTDDGLGYYRFDSYYVKDPGGYYCRYDYDEQKFSSVGVRNYADLTEEQLEVCTFTTSPSGAIDKIPNDHTVEIRDLLIDTRFRIVERESDIPKGYSFKEYKRDDGSYIVQEGDDFNSGTVRDSGSPHIIVENYRGWGITVQKIWSDDSFMLSHDNIYFAAFCKDALIPGTVRRMNTEISDPTTEEPETSLYYYFDHLGSDCAFSDYTIREVMINCDFAVDDNGYVTHTDATDITGDELTVCGGSVQLVGGGIPTQTGEHGSFAYSAEYAMGQPGGCANNVRTDTMTNSRPGIRIVKEDGSGNALAGARFSMTYGEEDDACTINYTSDSTGLITFAYPENGVTYTMTETAAPKGYSYMIESFSFTQTGGELTVTGTDSGAVTVSDPEADGTITITVKNYKTTVSAVKVDAGNGGKRVENAHFALYRQVLGTNGLRKDYYPLLGYEDLVSDENGVIPQIDGTLPVGTYYLCETAAPSGYFMLDHDIVFSLDGAGNVAILSEGDASMLSSNTANGEKTITISVPNRRSMKSLRLSPQTLIADFGLDIEYNVKENNYLVPDNSAYEYIGITDKANYDELGSEQAPALLCGTGAPCQGSFGTVMLSSDGTAVYQIGSMQFTGEDDFCLVAHVTQINGEAADVYAYEMLSYLPATTIYYEDDFRSGITFIDGAEGEGIHTGHDYGTWATATDASPDVEKQTKQAADLANNDSANIFGFDPAYTEFATYSNKTAHKVSVSTVNAAKVKGKWPSVEVVFAGTGFDLISVTGGDTGIFFVKVYRLETDGDQTTETFEESVMVDTYYGYEYGRVYLNEEDGSPTLEVTDRPLYTATEGQIAEAMDLIQSQHYSSKVLYTGGRYLSVRATYYDPSGQVTETPYYLDENGDVTSTVYYVNKNDAEDVITTVPAGAGADYVKNYAYAFAESWVMKSDATDALYQIPVVKMEGLRYGTYKAVIEPRFTTMNGHCQNDGTYDYYDLYVDAFRVYNPANVEDDGTLSSPVIQEAYSYSSEAYEKFTMLREVVVGANTLGTYVDPDSDDKDIQDGLVVIDGNVPVNSDRLDDFVKFGPNNELYLAKGMSLVFQLWTNATPADVQIQMKKISDSNPTLRVTYLDSKNNVYSQSVEIRSSTDLSYSLLKLLGKDKVTWTKLSDSPKNYSSGTFIISNVGEEESVISVTNLKWTYSNKSGNLVIPDENYGVAVSPKSVSGVRQAMSFTKKNMTVTQTEETPAVYADGAVTITVTTGSDVQSLVVRNEYGEQIDEELLNITYKDLDNGQRLWTVTVTETEDGDYIFQIAGESDGLASGEAITVSVSVDNPPQNDAEQPEDPAGGDTPANDTPAVSGLAALLEQLKPLVQSFLKLLKMLLSFFGIKF